MMIPHGESRSFVDNWILKDVVTKRLSTKIHHKWTRSHLWSLHELMELENWRMTEKWQNVFRISQTFLWRSWRGYWPYHCSLCVHNWWNPNAIYWTSFHFQQRDHKPLERIQSTRRSNNHTCLEDVRFKITQAEAPICVPEVCVADIVSILYYTCPISIRYDTIWQRCHYWWN